jgi:predicted glycosyltransferase
MLILASALSHRFRVVLIVITVYSLEIEPPAGVELHVLRRPATRAQTNFPALTSEMLAIATAARPAAVIVEYFPFGRHISIFYLLPFFKGLRSTERNVKILSSVRDILDREPETFKAASVAQLANQLFDGILVHSDPCLTRLEDTFPAAAAIRIPIYYTNYVGRHLHRSELPAERSNTIVVSAGGGRGGEALLRGAVAAFQTGLLRGYRVRILAGRLLRQRDWEELADSCSRAGHAVELIRWVPDLSAELRNAAVSVSRCGYNTAQELLAAGVPALVIPIATPREDEQLQRATILSRLGAVRMLREDQITAALLASEILETLNFRPAPVVVRLDGAERTCAIVSQLAAGQPVAAAAD